MSVPSPSERPQILPRADWSTLLSAPIAAAMTFLGVLTVTAALAAGSLAEAWRADLAGAATVRISSLPGDVDARTAAAIAVLRQTPGIAEARALTDAEQAELVAPWIAATELSDLPMPRLIALTLDGAGPEAETLQARLDMALEGAVYDDHAAWRAPLARAANAVETLAIAAALIVLLTAVAMVAFGARATLAANAATIRTLRLVGAENGFLQRLFVETLVWRVGIGALAGTLLGVAVLLLLPRIDVDPVLAEVLAPGWAGWLLIGLGVPLLGTAAALGAGHLAVRAALRRMA